MPAGTPGLEHLKPHPPDKNQTARARHALDTFALHTPRAMKMQAFHAPSAVLYEVGRSFCTCQSSSSPAMSIEEFGELELEPEGRGCQHQVNSAAGKKVTNKFCRSLLKRA